MNINCNTISFCHHDHHDRDQFSPWSVINKLSQGNCTLFQDALLVHVLRVTSSSSWNHG
jgi:hypothetical protein